MKVEVINSNAFITLYNSDEKVAEFCSWCQIDFERIESIFTETKIDENSKWVEYEDYAGFGFWATAISDLLLKYKNVNIEPILNFVK